MQRISYVYESSPGRDRRKIKLREKWNLRHSVPKFVAIRHLKEFLSGTGDKKGVYYQYRIRIVNCTGTHSAEIN